MNTEKKQRQQGRSPFHIRDSKIAELEAQIQSLRDKETLKPFVEEFKEALGLVLVNTPYEEWPKLAKLAFEHVSSRMETAAWMYRTKLPKCKSKEMDFTSKMIANIDNPPKV